MLRRAHDEGDPYRLTLVDLVMPNENGIDFAEQVLRDPSISNVSMILMTAFDAHGLGRQAIGLGFKGYIVKPVRQSQLLNCLTEVVCSGAAIIGKHAADAACDKLFPEDSGLILIVEDHPINQQVAQLYLDQMGLAHQTVNNGQEAVNAVNTNDYSAILMDCQMPVMDGYKATSEIRKLEKLTGRHVPIVAMTAHAMRGDRERCLAAGMDDYVSKPVDAESLRQVLSGWLNADLDIVTPKAVMNSGELAEVFDVKSLEEKYQQKFKELLNMFAETGAAEIQKVKESSTTEDWTRLLDEVHGLRGICQTVYSRKMQVLCVSIAQSIQEKRYAEVNGYVDSLEMEFERAVKVIADTSNGKIESRSR